MDSLHLLYIMISIAALLAYINAKYFKVPTTIGIMTGSLIISVSIVLLDNLGIKNLEAMTANLINSIDFHKLLMEGMLNFLLFAAALNVDLCLLKTRKWEIATLATISTITSMFIVATLTYYCLPWIGLELPFLFCLLFGALISPTDPIAVLAIFKELGVENELTATVTGESLFNDGVGIVLFITLYQITFAGESFTWSGSFYLFLQQAVGGIVYGISLGLVGFKLINHQRDEKVEILLTLAMATGGYLLAETLGVSGPLAMVSSGIFIGNHGKIFGVQSEIHHSSLEEFWELIDEILNAVLFLLIGLELLVLTKDMSQVLIGTIAIPIVLFARYISVGTPMSVYKVKKKYRPHIINTLWWGGLRGGLAVALALSLPDSTHRETILSMTYAVVVFSVLVQGLSIRSLIKLTEE